MNSEYIFKGKPLIWFAGKPVDDKDGLPGFTDPSGKVPFRLVEYNLRELVRGVSEAEIYKQMGNAVNVGVVSLVARKLFSSNKNYFSFEQKPLTSNQNLFNSEMHRIFYKPVSDSSIMS